MVIGLIITGVIAGFISTFFGVGGGIVIVPALYQLFPKVDHQVVIASSLGIIFVNCFLNMYNFRRKGRIPNFKAIGFIGANTVAGAIIASFLVSILSRNTIKGIFTAFLILVVLKLIFQKSADLSNEENWTIELNSKMKVFAVLVGLASGLISGLTGIGGGAILVPMFLTFFEMPMRWIPIYSNGCMIFATGSGVIIHLLKSAPPLPEGTPEIVRQLQFGNANLAIIAVVFAGAFITSRLGVKVNDLAKPRVKKVMYGALLTTVAIKMWL